MCFILDLYKIIRSIPTSVAIPCKYDLILCLSCESEVRCFALFPFFFFGLILHFGAVASCTVPSSNCPRIQLLENKFLRVTLPF